MKIIATFQRTNQNKENRFRKETKILQNLHFVYLKIQALKVLFYKIVKIKVVLVILGVQ
jgi:hypothetical protein